MINTLGILGASGHGSVVADLALSSKDWTSVIFFDDCLLAGKDNKLARIVGDSTSIENNMSFSQFVVAIGNNEARLQKQLSLKSRGVKFATLIHPTACVAPSALIGEGTVIMPGAVINANARIGAACIVNSNATVEHDCVLHDGVHVSPGASIAGGAEIQELSWVGIGAVVIQNVTIGSNTIIGAGAVVVNSIPANVTAVGVPAKVLKN